MMARAVPGANHVYPLLTLLDGDVERMNKASMRLYLQRRLKYIDTRIRALSGTQDTRQPIPRFAWDLNQLDPETWETVLQLNYLESMREAVVETLAALQY